jgi:kinesin family protein 18/19
MNSINVAVRVRPLSDKELSQLQPSNDIVSFSGQGSLTAGPSNSGNNVATTSYIRPSGGMRRVVKALDSRILVFDPPESSPMVSYQRALLGSNAKKVKDIRFCFDRVFDESTTQEEVFQGCAQDLVPGVLDGFNSTVFAYGVSGGSNTINKIQIR